MRFLTFQGDQTCPAERCGNYEWPITRGGSYASLYCHEGLTGQSYLAYSGRCTLAQKYNIFVLHPDLFFLHPNLFSCHRNLLSISIHPIFSLNTQIFLSIPGCFLSPHGDVPGHWDMGGAHLMLAIPSTVTLKSIQLYTIMFIKSLTNRSIYKYIYINIQIYKAPWDMSMILSGMHICTSYTS